MKFKGVEICCPRCHGDLHRISKPEDQLVCINCESCYPIILDIPDLRVFPDPYIGFEADRAKGIKVGERSHALTFEQLIAYYYSITDVVTSRQVAQFTRGVLSAKGRARATLATWHRALGERSDSTGSRLLDIGCGTGPLLEVAFQKYVRVVGIDIAFRWLVVAQKRLSAAGLDVPLFCACAEALPFPDQSFERVASDSSLEVVSDQAKTLSECRRVLCEQGDLFLSTPNRLSLGPDPHAGLWAGGYLPDSLVERFVTSQGGIPPKRRLLSARSLGIAIEEAKFERLQILLPDITVEQVEGFGTMARLAVRAYGRVKRSFIGNRLLKVVGPRLLAVSRKAKDVRDAGQLGAE